MNKNLFMIDTITRINSEDAVYLDKNQTLEKGYIHFSLGKMAKLLSNKNINRIIHICFWKFLHGHYYTKSWEKFLDARINDDGTTWVRDNCFDVNCNAKIIRDPKNPKIYCPRCERHYFKPFAGKINMPYMEKYLEKIKNLEFCQSCGKQPAFWENKEKIFLCNRCFLKIGDSSFRIENKLSGTKTSLINGIILSERKEK